MGADTDAKRRKSIAYILRRRKRGRKQGANSKTIVKSWAEYSEVNFTPTGSYSHKWRWLLPILTPILVFSSIIVIASYQDLQDFAEAPVGFFGWFLLVALALLLLAVSVFFIVYAFLAVWRSIRSHHKKE